MTRLFCCLLAACLAFAPAAPATAAPQTAAEASAINDAFLTGLAALDGGNPQAAIPIFRAILARHPDLIRVRLELGRALFANRQWLDARREFVLALSADLPDAVRRNVLVFIQQIDARRGFDWQLDLALTRLGGSRSFDSDTIELDFGGIPLPFTIARNDDRAIGLSFDISARASALVPLLSGPAALTTAFVEPFAFGDHADPESLRDVTYGLRGGLRVATARGTASAALVAWNRDLDAQRFETRAGVELAAERRGPAGLSVFATASYLDIENHRNSSFDGHAGTLSLGIRRALAGRASIGTSVFGEARRTDGDFDAYDRYGANLFGRLEAGFGLSFDANIYAARRAFRDPSPLFTASPDEREIGATLRVEKTDLFLARRFTPYVELNATRVDSDIAAFSYDERAIAVGLSKAF